MPDDLRARLLDAVGLILRSSLECPPHPDETAIVDNVIAVLGEPRMVSTSQAADILGVSRATLVRFLDDGRLPYTRPGRHRRILLADVLAFKQAVTRGGGAA